MALNLKVVTFAFGLILNRDLCFKMSTCICILLKFFSAGAFVTDNDNGATCVYFPFRIQLTLIQPSAAVGCILVVSRVNDTITVVYRLHPFFLFYFIVSLFEHNQACTYI